jgi:hypothetical protein
MTRPGLRLFAAACAGFLIALTWTTTAQAQCDWRASYAAYKVRSVFFKVAPLFGSVPDRLKKQLSLHRGDLYTSDKPNAYMEEVKNFLGSDPAELEYEKLVSKKLKFSFKGFLYDTCVEKVVSTECESAFKGDPNAPVTLCFDVMVRRRGVAIDGLNTSPFLVLFPRATLVKLLGAIPRPLLALNPGMDLDFDKVFGPSGMIDTSVDLLPLFKNSDKPKATTATNSTPEASPPPRVINEDNLSISVNSPTGAKTMAPEENPAPQPQDLSADTKLLLNLKARKSFDKPFYNTESGLALSRSKALGPLQNLVFDAHFLANENPQGGGTFFRNSITAGGSGDVRLNLGPFRLINVGGNYRWSRNRLFSPVTASELTSESAIEGRLIADGNLKKGLLRAAFWFDSAWPSARVNGYQRVAVAAAYSKDFVIARKREFQKITLPDQTECYAPHKEAPKTNDPAIGVEIMAGAGRAEGNVPEYARFYGGNSATNFLYDELSSQSMTSFPDGPLLRSAKRQQAGILTSSGAILGATSYWHVNASVSLPLPRWSKPLIPTELVGSSFREKDEKLEVKIPDGELICRDLKFVIKKQVRQSGKQLLLARLAHDSLSKAQQDALRLSPNDPNLSPAQRQALAAATAQYAQAKKNLEPSVDRMMEEEITPITDFIADHADLYSIKPLIMLDAARLDAANATNNRTRYGFGGGLQLNVVTVRFEAGYIISANRLPSDGRGNFVFRLVFRRFF